MVPVVAVVIDAVAVVAAAAAANPTFASDAPATHLPSSASVFSVYHPSDFPLKARVSPLEEFLL